ncbi:MAG: hypothetical protein KBD64_02085 [Gammaproteobacteria bacterium]|nr:hypothetical protein [Gammaproteobacteria bacterium]
MPLGVIGHGIPVAQQSSTSATGLSNSRFTAARFREITDGQYTLGEALDKAEWEKLFPVKDKIAELLKKQIFVQHFILNTVRNIINAIGFFFFLSAAIGLFARFLRFVTNSTLSANEDNFESARVFTDILGYYLAPAIITLNVAITDQIVLFKNRKNEKEDYKLAMKIYLEEREKIVSEHNVTTAFFSLTEILYELQDPQFDINYSINIIKVNRRFKKIFDSIKIKDSDRHEISIKNIKDFTKDYLIKNLKNILLLDIFKDIFDQIRSQLKTVIDSNLLHTIAELYKDKIDNDKLTQEFILDIIGIVSSKKAQPRLSEYLITMQQIFEQSAHPAVETAVIRHWNTSKEQLIHPYEVNLITLTVKIYKIMCEYEYIHIPKKLTCKKKDKDKDEYEEAELVSILPDFISKPASPIITIRTVRRSTEISTSVRAAPAAASLPSETIPLPPPPPPCVSQLRTAQPIMIPVPSSHRLKCIGRDAHHHPAAVSVYCPAAPVDIADVEQGLRLVRPGL